MNIKIHIVVHEYVKYVYCTCLNAHFVFTCIIKLGFYFWLCFTFRALLLLSVVMIRLSSVSPPQAPVNTDIYTLEEDKQDTTKRYVITCDSRHHAVLVHIWPDIYHPLTRQPVMHDKENENPQIFRASPNALSH